MRTQKIGKELSDEKLKNETLNKMIDISDQQYGTSIRKKYSTNNLGHPTTKTYNNYRHHLSLQMKTPNFIHEKTCEENSTGSL